MAFNGCNSLQSIRFGKGIEKIDLNAFSQKFYDETGTTAFNLTTDVGELRGRLFNDDGTGSWKMIRQPLYTLTFDCGDGVTMKYEYNEGDRIAKPENPERTGYSFMHWEKDGQEFDFANATMPAENMMITAAWTVNQYTITFDSDGGSAVDPITQDFRSKVEKPADPTREWHTFVCWMKDGEEYAFGTMPAENITLKAFWKANAFTVTFVTGTGTEIAEVHEYGEAITLPGEGGEISKTGYTLSGWQISGQGDAYKPGTEYTVMSDVTFTAVWEAVPSPTPPWDDDDDPYYPPSPSGDSGQSGKESDSSKDILIIVACIAAFMAMLTTYVCSAKR